MPYRGDAHRPGESIRSRSSWENINGALPLVTKASAAELQRFQDRDPVLVVRNGQREAVAGTSARVAAGTIPAPPDRPTNGHAVIHRSLDDRKVEEGGDVGSKLGIVLSTRRHGIALVGALDDARGQCRVHRPRRRPRDQDQGIALRAEVAAKGVPQLAALAIGRGDRNQRAAGGRERGASRVENLLVGIEAVLGPPEGDLVGDDCDRRDPSDGSIARRPAFDVDAVRQRSSRRFSRSPSR